MANDVEDVASTLQGATFLPDTELTVCNICGENHYTDSCRLLTELKPVKDKPTISRARLTLPSGLKIESLADGATAVVACVKFDRGTHFGPFQAHLTTDMHPGVSLPLKIFGKSGGEGYYLDTTDEETCNWMCLVAPASTASEQNLICYDMKESIYFTAIKDILPGEELRVWYAVYYGLKLQALPLADESDSEEGFQDSPVNDHESKLKIKRIVGQEIGRELLESLAQHLPAHSLGARIEKDCWQCRFCDKQEGNVALYAKHLMSHYRPKCKKCNRLFYSEKALSKHEKTIHASTVSDVGASTHQIITENINDATSVSLNGQGASMDDDEIKETLLTAEIWEENKQIESKSDETRETKPSHVKINLKNYGDFCPLMSVDEDSQEVITINNLNTSEIVQTQLVLTDDGSVVYHVANIPDGIIATEMDRLGLLVVDSGTTSEAAEGWCSETNDLESPGAENTFENSEQIQKTGNESHISVAKDKQENNGSVALLLLNSLECENQLLANQEEEINQQELNEQCDTLNDVNMQMVNNSTNEEEIAPQEQENDMQMVNNSTNEEEIAPQENDMQMVNNSTNEEEIVPQEQENDMQMVNNSTNEEEIAPQENDMQMVNNSTNEEEIAPQEQENSSGSFACDICSKTFQKSDYLIRHLRKHTGEFTCVNCLAVFARKENLLSHPCTRPMLHHPCRICGKNFSAKKYLRRHIPLHTGKFRCEKCKRSFVSNLSLSCHRCRTNDMSKDSIKCSICEQIFLDQIKLQTHLMHHSEANPEGNRAYLRSTPATRRIRRRKKSANTSAKKKPESISISVGSNESTSETSGNKRENLPAKENTSSEIYTGKGYICEICGAIFKSLSSMNTHRFLHGERRFECKICGKRFHRKDILQEHITVHQNPQLPCSECGKKLKTKKSLEVHMLIHVGAKRFTCNDCGKEFYQKGNLLKHQRVHAPPAERIFHCQHCSKTFTSREYLTTHILEHTQGKIFQCPHCSKSFVKKHLLEAHQQSSHSNRAFLCRYCNNLLRHRHSARRHLDQQHPDKQSEWSQPGFVDSMLATLPTDSLLLNNGGILSGQQYIRQEQLLSLRRQHFGTNHIPPDNAGKDDISATNLHPNQLPVEVQEALGVVNDNNTTKTSDNQYHLNLEEIATLSLDQQVELLADPLLCNPQLPLDEINVIPVPFEEKKQSEEILLEVVEPLTQESGIVHQSDGDTGTMVPLAASGTSVSKDDNTHVTIGGNTYILQDRVIFEEDEMPSGDIFLYVLDSSGQQ